MEFRVRNETFVALPSRILAWPAERLLVVADFHLGKAQTFHRSGMWLPPEAHAADLATLSQAAEERDAEHILFLGDFVHARAGVTPEIIQAFTQWKTSFAGAVTVVIGNHDRSLVKHWPPQWEFIKLVEDWRRGEFHFRHEPPLNYHGKDFVWCGHIHPKVSLRWGAERLSLPAFVVGERIGYLPAYSSLAGGIAFPFRPRHRYLAVAEGSIVEVGPIDSLKDMDN